MQTRQAHVNSELPEVIVSECVGPDTRPATIQIMHIQNDANSIKQLFIKIN